MNQQAADHGIHQLIRAGMPYALVATLHLFAIITAPDTIGVWTKPLLMPALAVAIVRLAPKPWGRSTWLLLAGVLFSWGGDVLLGVSFVLGLASFLVAHLAYIAVFLRVFHGKVAWWGAAYVVIFVALATLLWPHLGGLHVPVVAYGAVLSAMAWVATRGPALLRIGGALFLTSDAVLAVRLFHPDGQFEFSSLIIMATYLAAQGCISFAVMRQLRLAELQYRL